ncbi:MAG: hypothetical protein HOH33_11470 [Verrucomicrobia bacterium]|jgi:hypothetical protein|nr:hypothetical protein [Verrucomicrobiota bacterium]
MWQTLWTVLFFVSITIFAGMSVWVSIAGYHDLKRLFKRLNEDQSEDGE